MSKELHMAAECMLFEELGPDKFEAALMKFAALVRADERAEMRKGYAGVELWVGDAVVTQLVSQSVIENEIRRGLALEYAAYKCLAMYREARGNT